MKILKQQLYTLRNVHLNNEVRQRGYTHIMNHVYGRSFYPTQKTPRGVFHALRALGQAYAAHFVTSLVVVIFIFGGFGAWAAYYADRTYTGPAYPLKLALEKAQLTLSFNQERKTILKVAQLGERVAESTYIAKEVAHHSQQDSKRIVSAINKATKQAQAVKADIAKVASGQSTHADINALNQFIQEQLATYRLAINEVETALPENVKEEVQPEVAALSTALEELEHAVTEEAAVYSDKTTVDEDGFGDTLGEEEYNGKPAEEIGETPLTQNDYITSTIPLLEDKDSGKQESKKEDTSDNGVPSGSKNESEQPKDSTEMNSINATDDAEAIHKSN